MRPSTNSTYGFLKFLPVFTNINVYNGNLVHHSAGQRDLFVVLSLNASHLTFSVQNQTDSGSS